MRALLLVGVGCLALTGCAEHIELQAPPATAPVQTRVTAYNALRGLSYHQTTVTTSGTMGASSTSHYTDYLQLANGGRVYYPVDVLPVVADDSPSAKAAQAYETYDLSLLKRLNLCAQGDALANCGP
jgi:hypothetical protein